MTAVDDAIERADPSASASDVTQAFRDRYVLAGEVKRLRAQAAAVEALCDYCRQWYQRDVRFAERIRAAQDSGDEVQAK